MNLKSSWSYQVAPGCSILVKGKIIPAGKVFNGPQDINVNADKLKAFIESKHVRVLAKGSDHEEFNESTATANMPGVKVSAVGAAGKNGADGADPTKDSRVNPQQVVAPQKPQVEAEKKAPAKIDPKDLVGKSLEELNELILERDPDADIVEKEEEAMAILLKD